MKTNKREILKRYSSEIDRIKRLIMKHQIFGGPLDIVYGCPLSYEDDFVLQYLDIKENTVYLYDVELNKMNLLDATIKYGAEETISNITFAIRNYEDWLKDPR